MSKDYDEIKVLKNLEGVRQNLGMYAGNVSDGSAYFQCLLELISNSIDEYINGYATKISVCLYQDGSASICDNGRGIPVSKNKAEGGVSNLELALTKLHAGGKFKGSKNYNTSGGLHGIGLSMVCACSSLLRAIVWRDGKEYTMAFEKGEKIEELSFKSVKRKKTGTFIRFGLDHSLFQNVFEFDGKKTYEKLKELSYLCPGLIIEFIDERSDVKETFSSEQGLSDFVQDLAPSLLLDKPIYIQTNGDIGVNIALQWLDGGVDTTIDKYYTNNIPNIDGGSHQIGFKSGLTRTINSYISNSDLPKTLKVSLSGDDVRDGLVSVVSIKHASPSYSSQTKDKLVSDDARSAVETVISAKLGEYLEENPNIAKKIITQCVNSYKAREAARKAREVVRKSIGKDIGTLPGTLMDCSSRDRDECELFIVEGRSAAGSAAQGRSRLFQAIIGLKGKPLNCEKNETNKMTSNKEITNLITAIGVGIGKNIDMNKLRYGKIVLLMDSDVDGAHIRTLILSFIFRHLPQLIRNGNVYIAQPPLYRIVYRGQTVYLKNDRALECFMEEKGINKESRSLKLQRFKGLGEMNPEQLWDTTMNPETRTLLKVVVDDYIEADYLFNILMGNNVEPRRDFIYENALNVRNLDV